MRCWLGTALAITLACGVPAGSADAPVGAAAAKAPPLVLAEGGETVRIAQRGSAALPGSQDALSVQLGDVSGPAVALTLARSDGSAVLVARTVAQGDAVPFVLEGVGYELVVEQLHNELVGEDWVVVRVRAAGASVGVASAAGDDVPAEGSVDERARIEALIDAVARSGVVFIRNGTEHDSAAAAEHLRTKWSRAGDRIATADAFIEQLGSRSSQSGEAYRVRMPDGTERDAGPWLHELLSAGR
ncbi:MAG: DUF5329 domain-containing protein [Deltaproteobacteria bacterium]|nr:DUF5329 domain-containing protein [Nannocystaceae bacterium]